MSCIFLKIQRIWLDYYHINLSFFKFWNNPHKIFFYHVNSCHYIARKNWFLKFASTYIIKLNNRHLRNVRLNVFCSCRILFQCHLLRSVYRLIIYWTKILMVCNYGNIMYINILGISNSSNDVFMIRIIKYLKKIVFV